MKILLILSILTMFFLIGYFYKQKVKNNYQFLVYLKNYVLFLKSNISLYKVNMVKITDDFLKLQNEKNAKYNKIFVKNGEIYSVLPENVEYFVQNKEDSLIINSFFEKLGKNDYEYENHKIDKFLIYLDERQKIYFSDIKIKGDLTLKILIAVGLVISILVW